MVTAPEQLEVASPDRDHCALVPSPLPEPARRAASNLPTALFRLAALSQKLFGPSVMIESLHDPDAPQEKWIVFHVTVSGDIDIRREQTSKWYDEAARILPESATDLRLSIIPRQ